ncbi:MAG: type II TA system antitoxin MqsA family protein [Acidobacteriota bacterium]
MSEVSTQTCTNCGEPVVTEMRNYQYSECGISNVVLTGIQVADCPNCGNTDVIIPHMARIHRAIAHALANSPARLTGEQLRFLRKRLGFTGEDLGTYLHTDKTKVSKWERDEDRIGPATDRLVRLLVAALDKDLRPALPAVAGHLPQISDDAGADYQLQVDSQTLQTAFLRVLRAA